MSYNEDQSKNVIILLIVLLLLGKFYSKVEIPVIVAIGRF